MQDVDQSALLLLLPLVKSLTKIDSLIKSPKYGEHYLYPDLNKLTYFISNFQLEIST